MSAAAEGVVRAPSARHRATHRRPASATRQWLTAVATFAALGLYGTLRWGTLLSPAPTWRLLGMLAVAVLLVGVGSALVLISRPLAVIASALGAIAVFPIAGVPLAWVVHLRVAVTGRAIGQGLAGLPRVLVPYAGINNWVRIVTVLGAGTLLITAAVVLVLVPRALGDLRRGSAALALVALAVVPSTLAPPRLPYVQGVALFALLAAFVWGERLQVGERAASVAIVALAAAGAMVAAPGLDQHRSWIDYQHLAGTLAPAHVDTFDWSQAYGPLVWPRRERQVLDVQASHPDYWKTENLDIFDGTRWALGSVQTGDQLAAVDPSVVSRWTQTLQVTIRAMKSAEVIAAGTASEPKHLAGVVFSGPSPGTWTAGEPLGPGDSYSVSVYSPHPTGDELRSAGTLYPAALLPGYLSISLPPAPVSAAAPQGAPAEQVTLAPFGSEAATVFGLTTVSPTAAIKASPYARAFALARRLANGAATPYAFVQAVEGYLSTANGFSYDENPPRRDYPLASFLFGDKLGYCQQFAGAMALLLRLGGVPARVATGFTTGAYDSASRRWVVSDRDAHAWVEAWFPRYGWVSFDPTPAAAPARGGHTPLPSTRGLAGAVKPPAAARRLDTPPPAATGARTKHRSGSSPSLVLLLLALLIVLVALGLFTLRRSPEPTAEELVGELERALARSGRPLPPEVTLAALERRFRDDPAAAGYVRAIRLARFGEGVELPSLSQRRALRMQLRSGLGLAGRLRALWALPPRPRGRASTKS